MVHNVFQVLPPTRNHDIFSPNLLCFSWRHDAIFDEGMLGVLLDWQVLMLQPWTRAINISWYGFVFFGGDQLQVRLGSSALAKQTPEIDLRNRPRNRPHIFVFLFEERGAKQTPKTYHVTKQTRETGPWGKLPVPHPLILRHTSSIQCTHRLEVKGHSNSKTCSSAKAKGEHPMDIAGRLEWQPNFDLHFGSSLLVLQIRIVRRFSELLVRFANTRFVIFLHALKTWNSSTHLYNYIFTSIHRPKVGK